jgi:hypothetical protein
VKIGKGNWKYSEKTCPSATLSTTYPTLLDPVLSPGRRGGEASYLPPELWRGLTCNIVLQPTTLPPTPTPPNQTFFKKN